MKKKKKAVSNQEKWREIFLIAIIVLTAIGVILCLISKMRT
ncbi:MAG: hypothetical protein WC565_02725 [Parcubacteria group bacterium]